MTARPSFTIAGVILLLALSALTLVHILILLQQIPASVIWGGDAQSPPVQIVPLSLTSIALTFGFILVTLIRLRIIFKNRFQNAARWGARLATVYLGLNAMGNLSDGFEVEKLGFTIIAFVLAACALRISFEK